MFKGFPGCILSQDLPLDEVGVSLEDLLLICTRMFIHVKRLVDLNPVTVEVGELLWLRLKHVLGGHVDRVGDVLEG